MKRNLQILTLIFTLLSIGCTTSKTSVVIEDHYDADKDVTTLTIFPYGQIDIPGQWAKTKYDPVSRQHFFMDKDSTLISVTKNPQKNYPFYSKTMTEVQFAQSFFEWEKSYYEEKGFKINEKATYKNYVLWTANGEQTNTLFLYGAKNEFAYNFAVFSDNWPEDQRTEFLVALYNTN